MRFAKAKRAVGRRMVRRFQAGVGLEQIEYVAQNLPAICFGKGLSKGELVSFL